MGELYFKPVNECSNMFILFRITCSMFIISNSHSKRVVMPALFQDTQLRVLNGRDMKPNEYSAVIVLIDIDSKIKRLCTGFMITEYWGLTAAHCTRYGIPLHTWFKNFTEQPVKLDSAVEVLETYTHPAFRMLPTSTLVVTVENDISLFHSLRVNIKSFARLSSVDYSTMLGMPVTFVGCGLTEFSPEIKKIQEDMVRQLQVGEGVITKCDPDMIVTSHYIICVSPKCSKKPQRTYGGDSGGPLLLDHRVIGIASFGLPIKSQSSTYFTPISPYIDWIYQVMHSRDNY